MKMFLLGFLTCYLISAGIIALYESNRLNYLSAVFHRYPLCPYLFFHPCAVLEYVLSCNLAASVV